ncbi:MAG: hypothetical protein DMG57_28500 [Acidobacteria bacterium]|nr:MAG: hypothetical protein DMG57_28500 [Acidobacteriota bacterium]
MDFLAFSDHHDGQVYKPTGARNDVGCSGAIGIDVISASAGRPLMGGGKPLKNAMVHLGEIAFSVIVGHDHTTNGEGNAGCRQDQAFDGGSVIAVKGSVRTGSVLRFSSGKRA